MPIRKEAHTRSKFASQKYYEIVRHFAKTNLSIKDNKIQNTFKYLSGIETHKMHIDLERCYKIYQFYRDEYDAFLIEQQIKTAVNRIFTP